MSAALGTIQLPVRENFVSTSTDWQRLSHAGRYDMRQLKEAMLLIYKLEANLINFVRVGTHSELFSA